MDSSNVGVIFIQLIVAVGMGFWAKSICEKKGRSPGWGFVLGFILGIFGVIIASLLKPTEEMLSRPSTPKADETTCPHCLEIIKVGASVCKHCGKDPRTTEGQ